MLFMFQSSNCQGRRAGSERTCGYQGSAVGCTSPLQHWSTCKEARMSHSIERQYCLHFVEHNLATKIGHISLVKFQVDVPVGPHSSRKLLPTFLLAALAPNPAKDRCREERAKMCCCELHASRMCRQHESRYCRLMQTDVLAYVHAHAGIAACLRFAKTILAVTPFGCDLVGRHEPSKQRTHADLEGKMKSAIVMSIAA